LPRAVTAKSQDAPSEYAVTTGTWLRDWQIDPKGFAPSRPLSLLLEPMHINIPAHTRKANAVTLNHWDCDMEPDGTFAQRVKREKERTRQNQFFKKIIQDVQREDVKRAALRADVIDLTREAVQD
jgi:hypothetical protein